MRKAIQDFEKIRILREEIAQDASPKANAHRRALDDFLGAIRPGILDHLSAAKVTREGKQLIHRIAKAIQ